MKININTRLVCSKIMVSEASISEASISEASISEASTISVVNDNTSISEASISEAIISEASTISVVNDNTSISEASISVRFEYACFSDHDKPYEQPLFFIAMNIKNQLLKAQGKEYNEKMITEDIIAHGGLHPNGGSGACGAGGLPPNGGSGGLPPLEITSSRLTDTDFNLNYIMDRYITDIQFKYKGALLTLKTDKTDVKHYIVKTGHGRHTVTSSYIITYAESDFALFEDFIKSSIIYYKKFADGQNFDKNKIKMYISSPEGDYFNCIGSRPKRSLESVFLPQGKKKDIVQLITKFLDPKTVELYKDLGVNHKLTILLEGVPGTGKSSLIAALASHFNFNIALISFTPKMTDVGFLTSMRMWERKRTDDNEEERDTLLCIEDLDCIFKERKSQDESRNMVTFSGILNALDGITTNENQIVIMTTNHIEHLDPALIRPGRVDHIMRFDYATKEQIKEIYTVYTKQEEQAQAQAVQAQAQTQAVSEQGFYEAVKRLDIKITTSLLQQYLLKYVNNSALIFENIDELKTMYDACNKHSETKMYT